MARPKKGITFWDRVYSQTERNGACLIFTGCRDECGYGRINRDGKLVRLHREVWKQAHGTIPPGRVIMHTCDQPPCIEISHLVMATQYLNIKDMDAKGRRRTLIGSEHGNSVLIESDIPKIRARLLRGEPCVNIARDYGVSEGMIRHIKKGRSWTHVPDGT